MKPFLRIRYVIQLQQSGFLLRNIKI